MQNKKQIMEKKISDILQNYDLGKLVSYNLLTDGFANENYRIETEKGVFLFRVCKQLNMLTAQNMLMFMQILKTAEFLSAYPIQQNDGSYFSEQNDYPIIIYDFIEGEIPQLNLETTKKIGKAVAKINLLDGWKSFHKKNIIDIHDGIELINKFSRAKYQYPHIFRDFADAIHYLKDKIEGKLPKGFIHGDIFPDNTIFKGSKLMAIIDFEEYCVDNLLFDVAMTINGFCFIDNRLDLKLLDNFLNAYESIRPLSVDEKKYLPDYILWTAVGMASWHLQNDMLNTKNDKQTARVRVLLDRYKETKKLNLQFYYETS